MLTEEAIKRIQETMEQTKHINVEGVDYITHPSHIGLHKVEPPPIATMAIKTLTGLCRYLNNAEHLGMVVQIVDFDEVKVWGGIRAIQRDRDLYVQVVPEKPRHHFGQYLDVKEFIITMMSIFEINQNAENVLNFVSDIRHEINDGAEDDGITQKIAVKAGVSSLAVAPVPNPVSLIPFSTFQEVDQPEREFVFRVKKGTPVACALFATEDVRWKQAVVEEIESFINTRVKGVTIIA